MATTEKGTGGYIQVRDGDWPEVNRAFRYFCDMLDRLSGRRGSVPLSNNLDLNGKKAVHSADPTEEQDLVTKSYADAHYLPTPTASAQTIATGSALATTVTIVNNEIPAGAIDGNNATFTLANVPAANSLALYLRGVLQEPGVDYTLSGSTITMALPPLAGSYLRAFYQR